MRFDENWTRWRIKALILVLLVFFFIVGACRAVFASSWDDVLTVMSEPQADPNCKLWLDKVGGSPTLYRVWRRCSTTAIAYKQEHWYNCGSTSMGAGTTQPSYKLCGGGTGSAYIANGYVCDTRKEIWTDCKGATSNHNINSSPQQMWIDRAPCDHTFWTGEDCRLYDELVREIFITESCAHPETVQMSYSPTNYVYLDQSIPSCSCTPEGLIFNSRTSNYCYGATSAESFPCEKTSCVFDLVPMGSPEYPATGSPSLAATNGTGGSSGGSDSSGSVGPPPDSNTSESSTTTNGDGSSTSTQSGTSTSNTDTSGSSTTTTTTTITDPTGTVTSSQTTTTTETWNYPTINGLGSYSSGSAPVVGDFSSLFTDFADNVKQTPLFQNFGLGQMSPAANGATSNPVFQVNGGRYGNHTVDFSAGTYTSGLRIIHGFMLLLAGYLAIRILTLKR